MRKCAFRLDFTDRLSGYAVMSTDIAPPDHAAALSASISLFLDHLNRLAELAPAVKACFAAGDSRRAFKLALGAEPDLHDAIRMLEAASRFKREDDR